jgi:hypothetical protein
VVVGAMSQPPPIRSTSPGKGFFHHPARRVGRRRRPSEAAWLDFLLDCSALKDRCSLRIVPGSCQLKACGYVRA